MTSRLLYVDQTLGLSVHTLQAWQSYRQRLQSSTTDSLSVPAVRLSTVGRRAEAQA